jgi:hypothetical protein
MEQKYNELSIPWEIEFSTVELKKWEEFEITWNKIITVISWKIKERIKWSLETFESSVYHSWKIITEKDTVLSVFDIKNLDIIFDEINVDNNFWEYCRKNWSQLRKLWDVEWFEKVDLYRWNQIDLDINLEKYKLNLWFCWPKVDCLFHNEHDFIEIHTNISGRGFMQKSLTAKNDWTDELVETVWLMPWSSHRKFNIEWEFEENWNPKYPFHRWLGWKTWNIWLVIEKSL